MESQTWRQYIASKIDAATKMKAGNENMSNSRMLEEFQWVSLAKAVSTNERELAHYQSIQKELPDLDMRFDPPSPRGVLHLDLPLCWNEGKDIKRITSSYNIYVFFEIICGAEYHESDIIQLDLTKCQIISFKINLSYLRNSSQIKGTIFTLCVPKLYVERLLSTRKSDYMKTFNEYKVSEYAKFNGELLESIASPCVLQLTSLKKELMIHNFLEMVGKVVYQLELFPSVSKNVNIYATVSVSGSAMFYGSYIIGGDYVSVYKKKYWCNSNDKELCIPVENFVDLSVSDLDSNSVDFTYEGKEYKLTFETMEVAEKFLKMCYQSARIKLKWNETPPCYSKDTYLELLDKRIQELNADAIFCHGTSKSASNSLKKIK